MICKKPRGKRYIFSIRQSSIHKNKVKYCTEVHYGLWVLQENRFNFLEKQHCRNRLHKLPPMVKNLRSKTPQFEIGLF